MCGDDANKRVMMFSATVSADSTMAAGERARSVWHAYAQSELAPSGTMSALALEGYLTALLVCPKEVSIDLWALRPWGDAVPRFQDDAERGAVTAAMIQFKDGHAHRPGKFNLDHGAATAQHRLDLGSAECAKVDKPAIRNLVRCLVGPPCASLQRPVLCPLHPIQQMVRAHLVPPRDGRYRLSRQFHFGHDRQLLLGRPGPATADLLRHRHGRCRTLHYLSNSSNRLHVENRHQ
jgi:hypothetical protein